MWTRAELKEKGKSTFLRNFGLCVLVALILTITTKMTSGNNNLNNNHHTGVRNPVWELLL